MRYLTREQVLERLWNKGHAVFENDSRNYNLNIVGIRSRNAKLDEFGCQLMLFWKHLGKWQDVSYRITTYPGRPYLMQRLLNPAGCAILVPDQYRGTYSIRLHNGKYSALCQTYKPVNVYRDGDKDDQFDLDEHTIMSGMFGINIHNSPDNRATTRVGFYSAGCQVFSDDNEFRHFMTLANRSAQLFGNKFTYTLIDQ